MNRSLLNLDNVLERGTKRSAALRGREMVRTFAVAPGTKCNPQRKRSSSSALPEPKRRPEPPSTLLPVGVGRTIFRPHAFARKAAATPAPRRIFETSPPPPPLLFRHSHSVYYAQVQTAAAAADDDVLYKAVCAAWMIAGSWGDMRVVLEADALRWSALACNIKHPRDLTPGVILYGLWRISCEELTMERRNAIEDVASTVVTYNLDGTTLCGDFAAKTTKGRVMEGLMSITDEANALTSAIVRGLAKPEWLLYVVRLKMAWTEWTADTAGYADELDRALEPIGKRGPANKDAMYWRPNDFVNNGQQKMTKEHATDQ